MRYLAVLLLSSTLLACTTTQSTSGSIGKVSKATKVEDLSEGDKLSYQMGIDYIGRGEYRVADEKLLPLVKKYPNFTELYVMLGASQELSGKKSDALTLYSKAVATDPLNRMAVKHYAQLQCDPYDKNATQRMASIADAAMPELKASMSSGASACFLVHKNYQQANLYADRAIAANPNYGDSYYFKAIAANALNRPNEVFSALNRYHDEYGYEPGSVYLGLDAAKKARNKGEIEKYEDIIARHRT